MHERLRTPLIFCIAGLGVSVVHAPLHFVLLTMGVLSRYEIQGGIYRFVTFLPLLALGLLITGLVQLARARLVSENATSAAWIAAAALAVSIFMDLQDVYLALFRVFDSRLFYESFTALGDIAEIGFALAFGIVLREHARALGKRVDALVHGGLGVAALCLLVGFIGRHWNHAILDEYTLLLVLGASEHLVFLGAAFVLMTAQVARGADPGY